MFDFLSDVGAASDSESVVLVLVYPTVPGQAITRSDLRNFQINVLDRDDVFQPEFASNLVFVGAREGELRIEPGALDELANGQVKSQTYVDAGPSLHVAPGPYVFTRGKTWQPWRIYYDFNACFMTSLKPSPDDPKK
ncbi:hypothetical protein SLS64_009963 [Diaporthe eres]